jgi:hypothetical protein
MGDDPLHRRIGRLHNVALKEVVLGFPDAADPGLSLRKGSAV